MAVILAYPAIEKFGDNVDTFGIVEFGESEDKVGPLVTRRQMVMGKGVNVS
jgi:hypothetical protein